METYSPGHVLSPVDFSETSALGLRYAAAFAECSGASLTVIYADRFLPPPYFTRSRVEQLEAQLREAREDAAGSLRGFVETTLGRSFEKLSVEVVEAFPADAILQKAGELRAGLIAMGTHGRTGFNRLMLGSVAEHVLRASTIPVLTARPGTGGRGGPISLKSILCPVNNTGAARQALVKAAEVARCFDASLTVLHVKEPGEKDGIADLCAWVPAEARPGCRIVESTREGEAASEILAAASESPCDLLVIGAHHRRFFDSTVLGTTTVRVVRHAGCPVLTVV